MRSRAARLTAVFLFVVALGVTAYLFWRSESLADAEVSAGRAFDAQARAAARSILDVRTAQQGYVAAGQGEGFWSGKVAEGIQTLRTSLAALRSQAASTDAQAEIDAAAAVLDDFAQMDRRAREYASTSQRLLASDLIFSDGLQLSDSAIANLERARGIELLVRDTAADMLRRRQIFAVAAAAAAAVLIVFLLATGPDSEVAAPAEAPVVQPMAFSEGRRVEPADMDLETEGWSAPRRGTSPPPPAPVEAPPVVVAGPEAAVPPAPSADFGGVASLCTELARVSDTRALPALLERAATLLDASGIIVWIADPDGRELNPIFAQGYPPQLVTRLGTIPREAENATAAAFRTSLLQTVMADQISNGAIVAPLVTPAGCVGVMAAEVLHDGEKQDAKLAVAGIVAAQLATLVGPPSARSQTRSQVAGA